ncbi:hypothetical protein EVAR_44615_1 [Eumeta japonica]|uniref:AMP-dependent synthetase/ligase domain-containing protein n=1 Tax=Eumeta variegata TaxID=151549 RepID=A0A4C1YZK0_EUMVA|nr:hypothetical protein EVAR_44615_1 [Eumeta japonica]
MLAPKRYLRGDQEFQVAAHLNFGQYMIQCIRKIDKNLKALVSFYYPTTEENPPTLILDQIERIAPQALQRWPSAGRGPPKTMSSDIHGDTGEVTTYGEFLQDVANISVSLAELGIGKGHTVAICSERNNTFVATALAVICTGATYTPLDVTAGKGKEPINLLVI